MRILLLAVALGLAPGAAAQAERAATEPSGAPSVLTDTTRIAVFDSVYAVLDRAIVGLAAATPRIEGEADITCFSAEEKGLDAMLAMSISSLVNTLSLFALAETMETTVDRNVVQTSATTAVLVLTNQLDDLERQLAEAGEGDSTLAPRYRAQAAWLSSFREDVQRALGG